MYSLDICSLKMITTSKVIGRVLTKLKTFIHNNRRETIFNFVNFNGKVLYISFVDFKGVIPLQKFFKIRLIVIVSYSQSSFMYPVNFVVESSAMTHKIRGQ